MFWDDRFRVQKLSGLGLAAFVLGLVALSIAWIPCLGLFSLPISAVGAIIGFVAVMMARPRDESMGFPVAGIVLNLVAFAVPFAWILWAEWNGRQVRERAERDQQRFQQQFQQQRDDVRDGQAIRVSATKLVADYVDDERAADARYKDKKLEVEGEISFVQPVMVGGGWLQLKADDGTVTCHFAPNDSRVLGELKSGAKVVVRGIGDGDKNGPSLRGCLLKK